MLPSNSELIALKSSLIRGESKPLIYLLLSVNDTEIFKIIKEQKLILLYPKAEIIAAYSNSALRLLNGEILEEELRYLHFIGFYVELRKSLLEKLYDLSKSFCHYPFIKLLEENNKLIDSWRDELLEQILFNSKPEHYENMSIAEKANFSEIAHNSVRGRVNDAVFALLRLLNISQEISLKNKNDNCFERESISNNIIQAFNNSGFINSLEYVNDNLSYGTCKISKIVNDSKPIFWLDFIDENYVKSRDIGLRRMLAQKNN